MLEAFACAEGGVEEGGEGGAEEVGVACDHIMMITSASNVTYLPVEFDEQPFPQLRKLFLRDFECNPKT